MMELTLSHQNDFNLAENVSPLRIQPHQQVRLAKNLLGKDQNPKIETLIRGNVGTLDPLHW